MPSTAIGKRHEIANGQLSCFGFWWFTVSLCWSPLLCICRRINWSECTLPEIGRGSLDRRGGVGLPGLQLQFGSHVAVEVLESGVDIGAAL
jgi:hypothetical protein